MDRETLERLDDAALRAGMAADNAEMLRVQARLIRKIAVYDRRGSWRSDGATSMENWLVATYNVAYATACEWVRAARDLEELPALSEGFSSGALSFDAVAAAARLATPERDAEMALEAEVCPADLLEAAARKQEAVEAQSKRDAERKALRWSFSADGWYRFTGWLPPAEGAAVVTAIERAEGDDEPDPVTGEWDPGEVRAANALVTLASTALSCDGDPDRACVVVHVSVDELVSGDGAGRLACGGAVPAEVVRRLACDGRIETVLSNLGGVVGIGRASRQVPGHIQRYLKDRDGTCRFPGCGRRRHLHAHHIEHWAKGGLTNVDNLAMLCNRHHTLVHEGGWSMTGNPEPGPGTLDGLQFLRPDGTPYQPLVRAGGQPRQVGPSGPPARSGRSGASGQPERSGPSRPPVASGPLGPPAPPTPG